jgi:outer membrane protein OmpA-like peptidoglycan-associated protein
MKKTLILFCTYCLFGNTLFAQKEIPNNDKVVLIGEKTINTDGSEYSPTFYENGIVFISNDTKSGKKIFDKRQGKNSSSILIARRGPIGVLNTPEVFAPELTTSFNEGPVAFDNSNETIYFSTNHQKNGKKVKAKDGYVKQKIQSAKKVGDKWQDIQDLPISNPEYTVCHPTISVDGNSLYFASNMTVGFGGMDLYVCRKIGDVWGEPVNLGAAINTDKDEAFPYMHPDGTLYFASTGHNSLGGYDIFASKAVKGVFDEPQNIGQPFNSQYDDFGFILDLERKNGYFTSNRKGGKGEDDIYSFSSAEKVGDPQNALMEKPIVFFTANNLNGKEIENVSIKIMALNDYEIGDLVTDNDGNIIKLLTTDSTNILTTISLTDAKSITTNVEGKGETKLSNGDYLVNVSKAGYQTKQTILNVNNERDEFMVLMESITPESIPIAGTLKNNRGLPIANATLTLTDDSGGEPQTIKTDAQGNYKYYVKPNTNYTLSATKDNHLAASTRFNSGDNKDGKNPPTFNLDMAELTTPLPTGKVFQLNNVYYNYNDATLRPDARKDLDPLVSLLKTYPEVEIELSSHTDSRGKADYNKQLSQRRAESVVKYLTDRGIAPNRLKAVGYGESKLRNQCADGVQCSDTEHQTNRRTEVKVTRGGDDLDVSMIDKMFTGNNLSSTVAASGANPTKPNVNTAPSKTDNTKPSNTKINSSGKIPASTTSNPTASNTTTTGSTTAVPSTSNNSTKPSGTSPKLDPTKNPKVKVVPNDPTTMTSTPSTTSPSVGETSASGNTALNSGTIEGGTFWVVAGSYQDPKNADNQLAKIISKGYTNAIIVYAEDIRFYRVVVEFTTTFKEAHTLYKKLKGQREAAFILRG